MTNFKGFKEKIIAGTLGASLLFNVAMGFQNTPLNAENKNLTQTNRGLSMDNHGLEIFLTNMTTQRDNLQKINKEAIQVANNKLTTMEKRLPGIGGMLTSAKLLLDRTLRFNDAPENTDEATEIIKEAQLYPGNLDELQFKYMCDAHGIQNYEFTRPFFKVPFEDDAIVYVSSDKGPRKNIAINKRTGIEKYLGVSMHEGDDIGSKNKKIVAKYEFEVVLYGDFHKLPEGDHNRDFYGGTGRTAILRRHVVYDGKDYGYYRELFGHLAEDSNIIYKPGDIIHAGETIGIMGNTGLLSMGEHLHWAIYYEDKENFNLVDIFANKTYGVKGMPENTLYFFED